MKSDMELKQDIEDELEWEPSVNPAEIGVEVRDGIVTLAGHVDSYTEKWGAEDAAQRVGGVRGVAVEIDVTLPGSSQRTDADIARAANLVLQWNTSVPEDRIRVMVEDGWITLSGEVDWRYQREAAADALQNLYGVVGVDNEIVVNPPIAPSPGEVESQIEAALRRRGELDAQQITVVSEDGRIVLTGRVQSWPEHDAVWEAAWAVPGVSDVVDQLVVAR